MCTGVAAVSLPKEEERAGAKEEKPVSQNGTPETNQAVDLTNLFAGILMDDEPEDMEEDSAALEGLPASPFNTVFPSYKQICCETYLQDHVGMVQTQHGCCCADAPKAEDRQKDTILSRLQELPDDADIPGAVGTLMGYS